ncbi:hypothetical protein SAMN05216475_3395 [Pseudomonas synxantha]|uniref:Uncharacterized protein n=1 Tax=Pseudomonas synxantha TaxID=47883 RepID=A0AAX3I9P6_9PSED|nr:hypothetical protein C4K01_2017 [Pseudomonas synxantha]MDQ0980027.1 hypothetical protein [Pseudomonas synxantha]SDU44732.1 hypothetical protein SAMN05216475_3395 [Pseudomonas synxantha]VTR02444.1 Uncharacterised protein [Pseudomonas synxantha]
MDYSKSEWAAVRGFQNWQSALSEYVSEGK